MLHCILDRVSDVVPKKGRLVAYWNSAIAASTLATLFTSPADVVKVSKPLSIRSAMSRIQLIISRQECK
jgi:hypothetical protein